ncbi:phosphoribosylamine--glycine ligase [Flammeovirgaceae bacterium SG7u.111]|nr:phosphoribosylamine--glycine ligase [Flammeovirgaceae bacterium SG7u.132]WPO38797.1 phosphoribosylamine--glycine ligase [Flammeovirgaceae bacterium SG7u.111]
MNVLIVGSGGREHAFAWKLKQSPKIGKLYVAPGNAGTSEIAENVAIGVSDFDKLASFSIENKVDMIVVGPEVPLVEGIYDYFKAKPELQHINVIGPSKAGAMLEGSKDVAKKFMQKHNVPTGRAQSFTKETLEEGLAYLETETAPYVLKADGLAAGKGVLIIDNLEEAKASLKEMLDGQFGEASKSVLIEQHLSGIELSVFVLTDGEGYVILPEAKDYKRIGEGDAGLNTGGMGAVTPVPFAQGEFLKKVEEKVVKPTVAGIKAEGFDYKGFVFIGLMNVEGEPYVIEYNVRMGDPETEAVFLRVKSDLLDLFELAGQKRIGEATLEIDPRFATTVMLVSGGYPGNYPKGKVMTGFENLENVVPFHAGTTFDAEGNIVTNGGRVIAMSALGNSMDEALALSNKAAETLQFENKNYRTDIGFDLK